MQRPGVEACLECLRVVKAGGVAGAGEQGREAVLGAGGLWGTEGTADHRGPFRLGLRFRLLFR